MDEFKPKMVIIFGMDTNGHISAITKLPSRAEEMGMYVHTIDVYEHLEILESKILQLEIENGKLKGIIREAGLDD